MPPVSLDGPSGCYLSFFEREEIVLLDAWGKGVREIAGVIGRDPGTVSCELRRKAAMRGGRPGYRALVARWKARKAARTVKLVVSDRLREHVQERLSGSVRRPGGTAVSGPKPPPWKGAEQAAPAGSALVAGGGARSRSPTG